jgi:predicted RNA-binding protein with PUA-like domain
MKYWIMKSEPDAFSIDDLINMKNQTEHWDGIRNYQVRNFIRDEMKKGDLAFFYHSSCKNVGVVGVAEIVKEAYPDHSQFDSSSKYYDPKSSKENPRWFMVDIQFRYKYKSIISLKDLKETAGLENLRLVQKGNRLSICEATEKEFKIIDSLGQR